MRWAKKRDGNEDVIFTVLQLAGRSPVRFTDFDVGCEHVEGHGIMMEIKERKGRLRPIQLQLQALFKDRYCVCRTPAEALAAVGVKT